DPAEDTAGAVPEVERLGGLEGAVAVAREQLDLGVIGPAGISSHDGDVVVAVPVEIADHDGGGNAGGREAVPVVEGAIPVVEQDVRLPIEAGAHEVGQAVAVEVARRDDTIEHRGGITRGSGERTAAVVQQHAQGVRLTEGGRVEDHQV